MIAQARVPQRDRRPFREAFLTRLSDARNHADVARDRAGAIKAGWISEFRDQTSRSQWAQAFDTHQQFTHLVSLRSTSRARFFSRRLSTSRSSHRYLIRSRYGPE